MTDAQAPANSTAATEPAVPAPALEAVTAVLVNGYKTNTKRLDDAQGKLTSIKDQIDTTQRALAAMQAQAGQLEQDVADAQAMLTAVDSDAQSYGIKDLAAIAAGQNLPTDQAPAAATTQQTGGPAPQR